MVITRCTRNAVAFTGTWVRIPHSPPDNFMGTAVPLIVGTFVPFVLWRKSPLGKDIKTMMTVAFDFVDSLKKAMATRIYGKDAIIEKTIAALLADGHVLLRDVPGTGKTTLAKALADALSMDFHRIQFTPDLLPSDLIGVSIPDPNSGEFVFHRGVLFTQILLADEINRATPRTQSALLECMAEKQVTADGVTYPLEEPFFVIATENPVEMQGTFPLPEAQLDRFAMCLTLGYPERASELALLSRTAQDNKIEPVATASDIMAARAKVETIHVSSAVCDYLMDIARATRENNNVQLGLSTRGLLSLQRVAQAMAAIRGRDFVTPDDIKDIAGDCIAHRLILAGTDGWNSMEGEESGARAVVAKILETIPVPKEELWN